MEDLPIRTLGKSDLKVTPVGLGCWQFSKQNNLAGKFWPKLDDDQIRSIIHASLEGGINWFDTAEIYGGGTSEKALATALTNLGKKPGEVLIATKWWPFARTASNMLKTIDDRLKALSPYPIDLFQVHQPYGFSSEQKEMEAMAKLVKEKKIRHVGVSNFSTQKMRNSWETLQKHNIPLVSNQVRYSLLDRSIESNGTLDAAKELGITIIAYSPLAQGILTGKFHDHHELVKDTGMRRNTHFFKKSGLGQSLHLIKLIRELAEKYQVTTSNIALNWLLHFHGDAVVVIPGATTKEQAKQNTAATSFRLSEEDMARLDVESRIFT